MDVNRALRTAIDNGKVFLGARETARALKKGRVKLVIIAKNCRNTYVSEFNKYPKVPKYQFNGSNMELGSACGKPFPISSIAIIESGDSNIMNLVDETR
jgi:large subunit ribosomal protein L30e